MEEEEKARQKKIKKEFKAKLDKDLKDPLCDLIWKYNMWNRPIRIDPEVPEEDPNPNLPVNLFIYIYILYSNEILKNYDFTVGVL